MEISLFILKFVVNIRFVIAQLLKLLTRLIITQRALVIVIYLRPFFTWVDLQSLLSLLFCAMLCKKKSTTPNLACLLCCEWATLLNGSSKNYVDRQGGHYMSTWGPRGHGSSDRQNWKIKGKFGKELFFVFIYLLEFR